MQRKRRFVTKKILKCRFFSFQPCGGVNGVPFVLLPQRGKCRRKLKNIFRAVLKMPVRNVCDSGAVMRRNAVMLLTKMGSGRVVKERTFLRAQTCYGLQARKGGWLLNPRATPPRPLTALF
jgi:hypothetical protein